MMRVGVIFGGANSEHEVSCNSARSVIANLDPVRFEVVLLGVDHEGGWHRLESVDALGSAAAGSAFPDLHGVDVAFPVLHGRFGEDGTVQGLLELAHVPYVGCGVLASALAMDKLIAQRLLAADGIPTIPTLGVTAEMVQHAAAFAESFGYPVFVKPNRSGSSVGVSRVSSQEQLDAAIGVALEHDRYALVQPAVSGDELDVGVLQLPSGELMVGAPLRVVAAHNEFLDYEAKYTEGGATLEVPARIPQHVADRLADLAKRAFTSLDCDGLARIDFFVEADGNVLLNEVNTMPGLTSLSHYPAMWQAVGIPYPQLLGLLVERAIAVSTH